MKNQRRDDRSGGGRGNFKRRSFDRGGGRQRFGGRDDRGRMYQAVCADCGNECEVPFRPSGDRPVYCKNCFGQHRDRDDSFREAGERPERRDDKRMFSATCDNCGDECEVPFRPSGDRPIYCKDCFGKMGKGRPQPGQPPPAASGQKDLSGQFKTLNEKLDAILRALVQKSEAVKEEEPAPEVKVKAKATKKKRPSKV